MTKPALWHYLAELVKGVVHPSFGVSDIAPVNKAAYVVLALLVIVSQFPDGGPQDTALQQHIQPGLYFVQRHLSAFCAACGKFQECGKLVYFILHKVSKLNYDYYLCRRATFIHIVAPTAKDFFALGAVGACYALYVGVALLHTKAKGFFVCVTKIADRQEQYGLSFPSSLYNMFEE